MRISPSPLTFTPSTSAATFSVPRVAAMSTCGWGVGGVSGKTAASEVTRWSTHRVLLPLMAVVQGQACGGKDIDYLSSEVCCHISSCRLGVKWIKMLLSGVSVSVRLTWDDDSFQGPNLHPLSWIL